jgi:hypothetical protein
VVGAQADRAVERNAAFGYKPAELLTFIKPSGRSETP